MEVFFFPSAHWIFWKLDRGAKSPSLIIGCFNQVDLCVQDERKNFFIPGDMNSLSHKIIRWVAYMSGAFDKAVRSSLVNDREACDRSSQVQVQCNSLLLL
jgi:hypothetical protein